MKFSNSVYDVLKWLCLIALPSFSVFFAVLDEFFGWGMSDTVSTVVAAVCAFIGTLIGVSTKNYNGGLDDGASK